MKEYKFLKDHLEFKKGQKAKLEHGRANYLQRVSVIEEVKTKNKVEKPEESQDDTNVRVNNHDKEQSNTSDEIQPTEEIIEPVKQEDNGSTES